jgi:predicted permease
LREVKSLKGIFVIAPLFIVAALGMILRGTGFLNRDDRERLTRILYWIVLPMLLFRTTYMSGTEIWGHRNLFLATYGTLIIVPLMAFLIARFLTHRGDRKNQALAAMGSARANNVYLGMPAAALALGIPGMEAAPVYIAITLPGYNLFSILWGEVVMSGSLSFATLRASAVRIMKNPLVVSSLLGLLCAQFRAPIPETVLVSMKLVADMATGIALICLGMSLELSCIPGAIRRTWHDASIKLLLHPAVAWGLFLVWPVSEIMMQTAVLISSMPTAVNTFIIASGMGLDERHAYETVAVTTIFATITIPLWSALLGIG